MAKKKERLKGSTISYIGVKCIACGAAVRVPYSKYAFSSSESECDCCGSHGERTYDFKCSCGHSETIEIDSW